MKTPTRFLLPALLAGALLAGCDGDATFAEPPPPPPPAPMSTPLAQIVQDSFANTSETALPIDINALDPEPSDESPTLYSNLLQ